MPNDVDANHAKQVHHVAKPSTPLYTSCVNTCETNKHAGIKLLTIGCA